ncbi:MAG TPA: FAD-dependent oxidoreductase [Solirubrobacteraceae bacterium]|nr:FAD-dependent oxidoreductase [Solirubrobacteraceae bacterium]
MTTPDPQTDLPTPGTTETGSFTAAAQAGSTPSAQTDRPTPATPGAQADSLTRIAVIGSGPAGFYAAGHLLKDSGGLIEVDMFERLPTPWGLVRSGVAPDHPKIKSVTRVYEKTAAHPRFRFFGNVEFGSDIGYEELREHYHAIVYATGAPTDRPMRIPGEELAGSRPATEFVGWYNGHPDFCDHDFDLSCERAVVIGNGNVALDVARMLTLSHNELAVTDTADHALEVLEHSRISEIVVVGRRGPAQAAFTHPELLELGELEDADVIVDGKELERALAVHDAHMEPTAERNVKTLREYAAREPAGRRRRIVLRFLLSPVELRGDEHGAVRTVELVRNELVADADGWLRAQPTEERESMPAGLVMRAIGYRGVALPGVPFDERAAVIANEGGRVRGDQGVRRGEYVVGWIKRGPSGVIGTNKKDAQQTVNAIFEDLEAGALLQPPRPDPEELLSVLQERKPDLVTYEGWSEIDRHERGLGEPAGRPRVKLTRIEELLQVAASERVA